jgi:hypothetical protein
LSAVSDCNLMTHHAVVTGASLLTNVWLLNSRHTQACIIYSDFLLIDVVCKPPALSEKHPSNCLCASRLTCFTMLDFLCYSAKRGSTNKLLNVSLLLTSAVGRVLTAFPHLIRSPLQCTTFLPTLHAEMYCGRSDTAKNNFRIRPQTISRR